MSNDKFNFTKKGEGKLASDNHGITDFAIKRKEKIIAEQLEREKKYNDNHLVKGSKVYLKLSQELLKSQKMQNADVWSFNFLKKDT